MKGCKLGKFKGMETPLEFMDSMTKDSFTKNEAIRCIYMGLLCVNEDPDD